MVLVALAVVLGACSSGGGSRGAAVKRPIVSTTGSTVQDDRVGAAPREGDAATRFTLSDGTVVLVPVGALAKGAEVRVRRSDDTTVGQGAMEAGTSTYEISVTSGSIVKPIAVQLPVPDLPDRTTAVAVVFDDATRTWSPVNSDYSAGAVTLYASKPGTYAWVRWNWAAAADVAAQTMRATVGGAGSAAALPCGDAAALASRYEARSNGSGTLRWCAGPSYGDSVEVIDAGYAPRSVRTAGLGAIVTTRQRPLTDSVMQLVQLHWTPASGSRIEVLAPGDRIGLRASAGGGRVSLVQDGLSQYFAAVGGAAAFVAGLYAGTAPLALAALDQDDVRTALMQDLDSPGCADAAAVAFASTRPTDQVVVSVKTLISQCISPDTVKLIVASSGKRSALRAAFATTTTSMPDSARPLLDRALALALDPLLADGAAGDLTLTRKADGSASTVVPTPGGPTPVAVPTRTPEGATTTAAPAVTTTVAAATTTILPPTTTVAAATTTAAAAPTTTSTTAGSRPPPTLSLLLRECSRKGGVLPASGAGLAPDGPFTISLFPLIPPSGVGRVIGGKATAIGTMASAIDCTGLTAETWVALLRDDTTGQTGIGIAFQVAK